MSNEAHTKRILILDDEIEQLAAMSEFLQLKGNYDIVCAKSIEEANFEVYRSLRSGKKLSLALVDLHVGGESGEEFAQRLIDIVPNIRVIIVTGDGQAAESLSFQPDGIIIKGSDCVDNLWKTINQSLNEKPTRDVILNRWVASQKMPGASSLKRFTRRVDEEPGEDVEKIVSRTNSDGQWVSTVIYAAAGKKDVINIGVSSLIGCPGQCLFCKNWRNKTNSYGKKVPFVRVLSTEEIISQVYLAMESSRVKKTLSNYSKTSIVVNFTSEGDGLAFNLDNCAKAIGQLSQIEKPSFSFIITSIGSVRSLRRYNERYLSLPRVRHYWSVNSLDRWTRESLMPGTRGEHLEEMRDLYQSISVGTFGRHITASWIVIKGETDRQEDAEQMVLFFAGRPFDIKLMALVPGSLPRVEETTKEDVLNFQEKLLRAGMKNSIRIRKILGTNILSGCGNTIAADWK